MSKSKKNSSMGKQEGGNHYKHFKIQPFVFCELNNLTAGESNVIKYACRHRFKNGKQDLLKARHYIDMMIEIYYGEYTNEELAEALLDLNKGEKE